MGSNASEIHVCAWKASEANVCAWEAGAQEVHLASLWCFMDFLHLAQDCLQVQLEYMYQFKESVKRMNKQINWKLYSF